MTNVIGIIGEYNPFHNGHKYHLEKSKQLLNADYVVAVVSGNFVQRGNVSLIDKWAKAEMAINNGVDLVIELPTIYSISSAENFAFGAVKTLDSLNVVDYLSFGTETYDLNILNKIADILYYQPSEYVSILNHELSKGISFPKARENAILMYLNDIRTYANILSTPNNILGIEYLKSLKRIKSPIRPMNIQREGVGYNDLGIKVDILSNISKNLGIKMLVRSMSPDVIVADEIGTKEDIEAIKYAVTSGVKGIFTAHANNIEDVKKSPILKELLDLNLIDKIIILDKNNRENIETSCSPY